MKSYKLNLLSVVGVFALATVLSWATVLHWIHQPQPQKLSNSKTQPLPSTFIESTSSLPVMPTTQLQPAPEPKPPQPPPDYQLPPVAGGLAPLINHIDTTQPVVFLTIDDGLNKQDFEWQMMADNGLMASLFLVPRYIEDNPGFFSGFTKQGSIIENHTWDHQMLSKYTYDEQKQEICDGANRLQVLYGQRPVLFRPPGGDYNQTTLRAAADCGMKAVVLWIAKANGGSMQYQQGDKLNPGDIVLMHFRPEFKDDLQAFLDAAKASNLHTELLENWLK